MAQAILQNNIFRQWAAWHFFEAPKGILKAWRNFLAFNLNYFSIFLLLKTFFSPWRKYKWGYSKNFSVNGYLETAFSNFVSRFLGAFMRFFLILLGIFAEAVVFLTGAAVFITWLILPFLIFFGLKIGVEILLN